MLESSGFSLARAGVIVGLAGVCFLGAGFWTQSGDETQASKVHVSQALRASVDQLLAHVRVSDAITPPSGAPTPSCNAASPDHPRWIARLEALDQQLRQLHEQGFVKQRYRLDVAGWLSQPQVRDLSCQDAGKPLQWVLSQTRQSGLKFLETLQWKERQPASRQMRYPGEVQVVMGRESLSTRSPWFGVPGCIFWTDAATGAPIHAGKKVNASNAFCQSQLRLVAKDARADADAPQLPGLPLVLDPLSSWRMPQSDLYQRLIGDRNQFQVKGQPQPVGLHAQLGIDPHWQNRMQMIAQCFTGVETPFCKSITPRGAERYESARVRMAGVAVVDVPTGRVVVAASASSPCFEHDKTRSGPKPKDCPALTEGNVHRPRLPQAITNHAVFTQAPPGSLVKPILMAGILQSPLPAASLTGLDRALQASNSQHFLDAMLCRKQLGSGPFAAACDRPQRILESVHRLGWNAGCDGKQDWQQARCGMVDLLRGTALADAPANLDARLLEANLYRPAQLPVLTGQLMVEAANTTAPGWKDMPIAVKLPTPEQRLACAQSGRQWVGSGAVAGPKGYVRCKGPRMELVSEGYGQGNAQATPVGVAGLLGALAGSAQGLPARSPHLLIDFWTTQGRPDEITNQLLVGQGLAQGPAGLDPAVSQRVIAAMETTHIAREGTAHAACKRVMGEPACLVSLGIAGKTGTPGDADERSLQKIMRDQALHTACVAAGKTRCHELHPLPRPRYRWYAALFKSAGSTQYDKAIAVLVHSNWRRADGRYADDENAAAEIAFHAIRQVREMGARR